jgi:hypothetical protein
LKCQQTANSIDLIHIHDHSCALSLWRFCAVNRERAERKSPNATRMGLFK